MDNTRAYKVVLNIAVTGETGAGKSSFVNAIRRVKRGDEGWAPTGVIETTMERNGYTHPTMPNVKIWDLPGIGSQSFDAKNYIKTVHFEKYDFFIIVSASRFRENDLKLANEIKTKKKKFYFVRSKIDDDVRYESEDGGGTEEEILLEIRKNCEDNLRKMGDPPVFLITSRDLMKYDFPALVETLIRDLSSEKRDVVVQSLYKYSIVRAMSKAEEIVNDFTLNIAVIGETGVGKSSFVNAIRGVQRGDEGWAPTGVIETTMECNGYTHPTMPNVKIWDLPGIGSPKFNAKNYVKEVHFEKYDLFIIVSASRFRENDLTFANVIRKKKGRFYYVRSKIDCDVRNEMENGGETEEEILHKIRKDCEDNLSKMGGPPVFLISSKDLSKFDFQTLLKTLKTDLSTQYLDKKYYTLQEVVWELNFSSVPSCNAIMVLSFLLKCYFSFGLDNETLGKLSKQVHKPILAEVKKSELIQALGKYMLTTSLLTKLRVGQRVEDRGFTSFMLTLFHIFDDSPQSVLQEGLDELYYVAKTVIEMAEQ